MTGLIDILEKLAGVEARYEQINQLLMEIGDDYQRAAELGIERAELEPIVTKSRQYRVVLDRLDEARSLLVSDDEELHQLAQTGSARSHLVHNQLFGSLGLPQPCDRHQLAHRFH